MTTNNTLIQIKHSTANDRPISLNVGELAYSYKSNVLWIGTPGGTNAFAIIGNRDYESGNTKWTTNSDTLPVGNLINFTSATYQGTIKSNVGIKLTSASNSWTFNANGNIVFPDGSVQTTAYSSLSSALDGIARITANAAFDKANAANVLAFNTGVGANAYAATVGSSTNTYIRSIIAGANSAVGTGANSFASATIAGANSAVGAGANAWTNSVVSSANTFLLSVISGANTAVGTGANTYLLSVISGANTTVGAGANAYTNTATSSANAFLLSVIAGANVVSNAAFAQANTVNVVANAAFSQANAVQVIANASFTQANAVQTIANSAFLQANVVQFIANLAFNAANAAFAKANTGTSNTVTSFTSNVVISVADSTNAALRITQTGTSPAILVEDDVNPDSSPFVVDANGSVGIGTINPQYKLDVNGSINIASTLIVGGVNIANSIAFANTTAIAAFEKANTGTGGGGTAPLTVSEYSFTGDGSTTVYTLGSGAKTNNTLVIVNGVVQPNAAYTLNDSTSTATLSEAPALNDRVFFKIVTGNTATITTVDNSIITAAYNKANDANILAFSSFTKANSVQTIANLAYDFANTVNIVSNAAFAQANTVNVVANAAFTRANAAQTIAIAAFAQANVSASGNVTTIMSNTANALSGTSLIANTLGTVFSTGAFANYGDAVVKEYILRGVSTSATEIELFINGSGRIPVPTNTTVFYTVDIAARRTDTTGFSGAFFLKGASDSTSGVVSDVGSLYEVIVARDSLSYTVDIRSNDGSDTINIYATGAVGHTVRWVAHVKTVEVAQ